MTDDDLEALFSSGTMQRANRGLGLLVDLLQRRKRCDGACGDDPRVLTDALIAHSVRDAAPGDGSDETAVVGERLW